MQGVRLFPTSEYTRREAEEVRMEEASMVRMTSSECTSGEADVLRMEEASMVRVLTSE